jgi:hypothetical protein
MKKAKIMLAAIALITVVGGVFAFKSAKSSFKLFYVAKNSTTTVTLSYTDVVSTPTIPGEATTPLPTVAGYTAITGFYSVAAPTTSSPIVFAYNAGE